MRELAESKVADSERATAFNEFAELTNDFSEPRADDWRQATEIAGDDIDEKEEKTDPADDKFEAALLESQFISRLGELSQTRAFVDFIFRKRALIQRAATRWLTNVAVVQRCVIWHKPLMDALQEIEHNRGANTRRRRGNFDWSELHITDSEIVVLQQFYAVGRACESVLKGFEGDKRVTIGTLLWMQHRLVTFLMKQANNTLLDPVIVLFCQRALEGFELKFTSSVDRPAMISAILDPRFKKLSFLSETEAGKCREALRSAYEVLLLEKEGELERAPPPAKRTRVNRPSVVSDFTSDILEHCSPSKGVERNELEKYLHLEEEERGMDPLDWWRDNARRYPTLAVLARRYLAIPASSASSERLFSRLKLTASAARQGMSADTLCQLLFVSCHQRSLDVA